MTEEIFLLKGDGDSLKETANNVTPVRTNTAYASQKESTQKQSSLSQKESSSASLAAAPTAKSVVLDLHANPEVCRECFSYHFAIFEVVFLGNHRVGLYRIYVLSYCILLVLYCIVFDCTALT